jgi:hypothetical protein
MVSPIIAAPNRPVLGLKVLDLKVGDPIPTQRSWRSVLIDKDLAEYLLGKNHEKNRPVTPSRLSAVQGDIEHDRWYETPASIVFDVSGVLADGQNRLTAVKQADKAIWSVITFGWPEDTIHHIDLTSKRTGADILHIHGIKHASTVSAAISRYSRYKDVLGKNVSVKHNLLSAPEMETIFVKDPDLWEEAGTAGTALYRDLGRGLTPNLLAAVYFLIEEVNPGTAGDFFEEIGGGLGMTGSATRDIQKTFLNKAFKPSDYNDRRIPYEALIRAYNSYMSGSPYVFPQPGRFQTTPVAKHP